MRLQAIRASETLYKAGDRSFAADYHAAAKDRDADVVIQAMLTSKLFNLTDLKAVVESAQASNAARGVQEIGRQILDPPATFGRGGGGRSGRPPFSPRETATMDRGDTVYKELCFACHGADGRGAPQDGGPASTTMALSLASSPRVQGHPDYVIKTLLHGMTGPLDGKTYPAGVMMPLGANSDEWIAAIASYVHNSRECRSERDGARRSGGSAGIHAAAPGFAAQVQGGSLAGWQDLERSGRGRRLTGQSTVIAFQPVRAKLVRITQTANVEDAPAWSIQRLRLFEAPEVN